VLAAVCKNGLAVRFDSMIPGFGGKPTDAHAWNFMIAAAAYRTFALPLHQIIGDLFAERKLEPERAARLMDMLFWLEGDPDGIVENPVEFAEASFAEATGREAFHRCKDIIASVLYRDGCRRSTIGKGANDERR